MSLRATNQYAPFEQSRKSYHRTYKNSDDNAIIRDISNAPSHVFHVGKVIDRGS